MSSGSRWTIPLLRISMGLFLALWGVDKLVASAGAAHIFGHFYHVAIGPALVRVAGVLEVLLGAILAVGWWRRPAAWLALALTAGASVASWRQILDPWGRLGIGPGGSHLFLASIVLTAVSVVLVLDADAPTFARRGRIRPTPAHLIRP